MSDKSLNDWTRLQLGKVATLQRGFDLPVQNRQGGKTPVYGSNGIDGYHNKSAVKGPGVITGRSGSIGSVFYEVDDYWPLNTSLYVNDFHGNNRKFVARLLESLNLKNFSASTGVPSLNRNFIHPLIVCRPPVAEQSAIATILDNMDEAIHQTEAVIAKLRQVKAGILYDLLTRGLDENGELRDPIRHPKQFKDSPLGRIPSDWEIKGILDIAPIVEGQVDPKILPFADYLLVAPDHIESGTGRLLSLKTAAEQGAISGKYRFQAGDVVYSKIRPYLRKVWLASFEGLCSADMYPFRPGTDTNSQFLLMTLLSERFSTFAISVSERSGFPKINRKELSLFDVILPPKREQDRIVQAFQSVEEKLLTEQICKNKLHTLKQGLMHDLLTGTVRIPPHLLEAIP